MRVRLRQRSILLKYYNNIIWCILQYNILIWRWPLKRMFYYLFRRLGIPRLGMGGRIILLKRILHAWTMLWCTLYMRIRYEGDDIVKFLQFEKSLPPTNLEYK